MTFAKVLVMALVSTLAILAIGCGVCYCTLICFVKAKVNLEKEDIKITIFNPTQFLLGDALKNIAQGQEIMA